MSPSTKVRQDVVRITIPLALYGDEEGAATRAVWAEAIRKMIDERLPAGHSVEVSHRRDTGIVIRATFNHPAAGSAGALTAAAWALETVDVALQDVARRYRNAPAVVQAIKHITVKTNGAG